MVGKRRDILTRKWGWMGSSIEVEGVGPGDKEESSRGGRTEKVGKKTTARRTSEQQRRDRMPISGQKRRRVNTWERNWGECDYGKIVRECPGLKTQATLASDINRDTTIDSILLLGRSKKLKRGKEEGAQGETVSIP